MKIIDNKKFYCLVNILTALSRANCGIGENRLDYDYDLIKQFIELFLDEIGNIND